LLLLLLQVADALQHLLSVERGLLFLGHRERELSVDLRAFESHYGLFFVAFFGQHLRLADVIARHLEVQRRLGVPICTDCLCGTDGRL
jgi:hypothetical protein